MSIEWRRPCEHGRYEGHRFGSGGYDKHPWYEPAWTNCPGGSSVTTKDLLDALIAEGVLTVEESNECRKCAAGVGPVHEPDYYVGSRRYVSEYEYPALLIREEQ